MLTGWRMDISLEQKHSKVPSIGVSNPIAWIMKKIACTLVCFLFNHHYLLYFSFLLGSYISLVASCVPFFDFGMISCSYCYLVTYRLVIYNMNRIRSFHLLIRYGWVNISVSSINCGFESGKGYEAEQAISLLCRPFR